MALIDDEVWKKYGPANLFRDGIYLQISRRTKNMSPARVEVGKRQECLWQSDDFSFSIHTWCKKTDKGNGG
ncbi:hypothetical protein NXW86_29750, partial [Bacteroides thetaiotaomicron]